MRERRILGEWDQAYFVVHIDNISLWREEVGGIVGLSASLGLVHARRADEKEGIGGARERAELLVKHRFAVEIEAQRELWPDNQVGSFVGDPLLCESEIRKQSAGIVGALPALGAVHVGMHHRDSQGWRAGGSRCAVAPQLQSAIPQHEDRACREYCRRAHGKPWHWRGVGFVVRSGGEEEHEDFGTHRATQGQKIREAVDSGEVSNLNEEWVLILRVA